MKLSWPKTKKRT